MEKTKCNICKYCKDLKGFYCYCTKKNNRVRVADKTNCDKFVKSAGKLELYESQMNY